MRPLPYRDWRAVFESGGRIASYDEYQKYVRRWTEERMAEQTEADKVRSDYIDMLKSIYVYLDEDERRLFDSSVDWDSRLDLARVVPMFARKIRDIIRYFADKRESVIRSRPKYNMHGTFLSLERMLHEYLLSNYTRRRHYEEGGPAVGGVELPDLYDVNTKLHTRIREFYDGANYFDKSPDLPPSAYFPGVYGLSGNDAASAAASAIYDGWDLGDSDEADWLFGGGYGDGRKMSNPMIDAVRGAVLATSGLSGSDFEEAANKYLYDMTRRYLGNNIVVVSGGNYQLPRMEMAYDFYAGNNWFYFPSGVVQSEAGILEVPPISIHDTTLAEQGTGGGTYDTADRIFVRRNGQVAGAWLKQPKYTHAVSAIEGLMPGNTPTQFRFPFLGYGLSAEGMDWTGPTLTNRNPKYDMLTEQEKVAVQERYWDSERPDFGCDSVGIQELGFVEASGATPATAFWAADHLSVRKRNDVVDRAVYSDGISQYWLYSPTDMEAPIGTVGRSLFSFSNPVSTIIASSGGRVPLHWADPVRVVDVAGACAPGAVGGPCMDSSDAIYRVDSGGNTLEGAWLSARAVPSAILYYDYDDRPVPTSSVEGLYESFGFSFTVEPGEDYRFVWTGSAEMIADVFFHHEGYPEFSPVEYVSGALDYDYVYQDLMFPFDMDIHDARDYGFRLENGEWVAPEASGAAAVPMLRRNCIYCYHRSASAPAFRAIHAYVGVEHPPVWKKMYRGSEGVWIGGIEDSDMQMAPGDSFAYEHYGSSTVRIWASDTSSCRSFEEKHGPFALRIPLTDTRPYWTEATNTDVGMGKPVDVYSSPLRVVDGVPLWVPEPASVTIKPWDILTYFPRNKVYWRKEIGFDTPTDEVRWKALSAIYVDNPFEGKPFDDGQLNVLSAVPTDVDSDIVLSYVPGDVVLVNYVAVNPFRWTQEYSFVSVSDNAVSGYMLSPETRTTAVEAAYPHANLSNRHYPSYAIAADPASLYTEEDVGGYFVPSRLGVTVAMAKDVGLALDPWGRGPSGVSVFTEGDVFAEDQGFTRLEQNVGLSVSAEDETWTRVSPYPVANAGMRNGNDKVQSFVPYLTEEENRGSEDKGVSRAGDFTEPWLHDGGERWNPYFTAQGFVPHMTLQEPTRRWAASRFEHSEIAETCSDMNGVQYALLKTAETSSIYRDRESVGKVFYRAFDDSVHGICDLCGALSGVDALRRGWVYDIDCARDVFFARCRTPDGDSLPVISVPAFPSPWGVDAFWVWYCERVRPSFAGRFSAMADMYGVPEFLDVVPDGFVERTESRAESEVVADIRRLLDGVMRNYVDVSLDAGDRTRGHVDTWLHEDLIVEAISKFDGRFWFNTAYESLSMLAAALNGSRPFEPSVETVVSVAVSPERRPDGRYEAGSTVGVVDVKRLRNVETAPGWYMNREKRYVVPVVDWSSGYPVPSYLVEDLADAKFNWRRCRADELETAMAVYSDIAGSIPGELEWGHPVCSYNDDTNVVTVVRQASGAGSEVGGFAVYMYDMVDDSVGGYAILPRNTSAEFEEYVRTHRPDVPEDTSGGGGGGEQRTYWVRTWRQVESFRSGNQPDNEYSVIHGSIFSPPDYAAGNPASAVDAWLDLSEEGVTIDFRYDAIFKDLSAAPTYKLRDYDVSFNRMNGMRPEYRRYGYGTELDPGEDFPDKPLAYEWTDMLTNLASTGTVVVDRNLNYYLRRKP